MGRKYNSNTTAEWENNETFLYYYNLFKDLAINNFEWINLPDNGSANLQIDPRFIELTLFEKGYALFYYDDVLKTFNCLPCTIGGRINNYHIPQKRAAIGLNGYTYPTNSENSVIIFNNYLRTPDEVCARMFARRLMNIQRTIDVNLNNQKTPYFVIGPEEMRLSLKNIVQDVQGNVPAIFTYKSFDPSQITVFNTPAPYLADKLAASRKQEMGEALTYLGIVNSSESKKERQISGEIKSMSNTANANMLRRLNARKDACALINEMFGLNLDVKFRLDNSFDMYSDDELERFRGFADEQIYSDPKGNNF